MTKGTTFLLAISVGIMIAVSSGTILYLYGTGKPSTSGQDFLIIANSNGFNDSIDHGAPQNSWPVIHVPKGTVVNITVYNDDHQAHGFQITHYFDSTIKTVAPGQKLTVVFVADEAGSFKIYCSIFCTVHAFMQSGLLVVT